MSFLTAGIRQLVSKNKRRLNIPEFNLDLTYITDRIIAMGYPAEHFEGVYRNHIDEVVDYFERQHKDHYKVYNLCTSQRRYNESKFKDRVAFYPFEDHHPPSFLLMEPFCKDLQSWLEADPQNVAAIHCKAGKGRTGVMICAYLLYTGVFSDPYSALQFYGRKRCKDNKGVTIASQKRYVDYFGAIMNGKKTYTKIAGRLTSLVFHNLPETEAFKEIYRQRVYKSQLFQVNHLIRNDTTFPPKIDILRRKLPKDDQVSPSLQSCILNIPSDILPTIAGDVRIEFFHKPTGLKPSRRVRLFHFWFNTFFLCSDPPRGSPNFPNRSQSESHILRKTLRSTDDVPDAFWHHHHSQEDFSGIEILSPPDSPGFHLGCNDSFAHYPQPISDADQQEIFSLPTDLLVNSKPTMTSRKSSHELCVAKALKPALKTHRRTKTDSGVLSSLVQDQADSDKSFSPHVTFNCAVSKLSPPEQRPINGYATLPCALPRSSTSFFHDLVHRSLKKNSSHSSLTDLHGNGSWDIKNMTVENGKYSNRKIGKPNHTLTLGKDELDRPHKVIPDKFQIQILVECQCSTKPSRPIFEAAFSHETRRNWKEKIRSRF